MPTPLDPELIVAVAMVLSWRKRGKAKRMEAERLHNLETPLGYRACAAGAGADPVESNRLVQDQHAYGLIRCAACGPARLTTREEFLKDLVAAQLISTTGPTIGKPSCYLRRRLTRRGEAQKVTLPHNTKNMEKQGIEPWTSTMLKLRYTT